MKASKKQIKPQARGRSLHPVVGMKIVRTPKQVGRSLQAKLHNRRIKCRLLTDGSYEFSFKRYVPNQEIQQHGLRLTEEALCAMLQLVARIKQANPANLARESASVNQHSVVGGLNP